MTDERPDTDANDVTDPLVTRTYREVADERTPASLNERILRDATAAARPGYSRSILWLRPMAWAATIGLCLAIVVELASTPQFGGGVPEIYSTPADRLDSPAAAPALESSAQLRDAAVGAAASASEPVPESLKVLREQNMRRPESKVEEFRPASQPAESAVVEETTLSNEQAAVAGTQPRAAAEAGEFATVMMQREAAADAEAQAESYDDSMTNARSNFAPAGDMLGEADTRARSQIDQASGAVPGMGSEHCSSDAVAAPDLWFECIRELESAGRLDAAAEERALLEAAYPDFTIPDPE